MTKPPLPNMIALFGPFAGLAVVWTFLAIFARNFATADNHRIMLLQTAVVGIASIGATIIIISGGLDLSVGSSIALGTMVVALLLEHGAPAWVAALGGVGTGVLVGAVIGLLVTGRRALPPFVVTLGLWGALRGLAEGLGRNQPVTPRDPSWLPWMMNGSSSGFFHAIPASLLLLGVVAVAAALVLRRTVFGRRVFAIGDNEHAALVCGVPVRSMKIRIYAIGVGCAGLASVLQFGYLAQGDPTTAQGLELKVIAAVVIGGASLSGGVGTIGGTLAGAMLMTIIDNGCTKLGIENWVQKIMTGGIIVAAVALDRSRRLEGRWAR